MVRDFINQDGSKFTVIRNQENRGPAFSRNRCIEVTSGEYFAIQDAVAPKRWFVNEFQLQAGRYYPFVLDKIIMIQSNK
ncbi:MAG TPA: hypothetical protein DDW17_00575 [Deltaproteobacteria bacterium]|nr:hypothetical protein [Deltaproteobacteria bacterium]